MLLKGECKQINNLTVQSLLYRTLNVHIELVKTQNYKNIICKFTRKFYTKSYTSNINSSFVPVQATKYLQGFSESEEALYSNVAQRQELFL